MAPAAPLAATAPGGILTTRRCVALRNCIFPRGLHFVDSDYSRLLAHLPLRPRMHLQTAWELQAGCGVRLQVLDSLKTKGISIRVASPKLVMEEAPESYKDVSAVVDTCHQAGISKKTCRLRPICVIKG